MMGHLRVSSLLIGCTLEGIRSINQPTNSKRPSMNDWRHAMLMDLEPWQALHCLAHGVHGVE